MQSLAHLIGHQEVAIEKFGLLGLLIWAKHRRFSCTKDALILSYYLKNASS
jgi:hypothetical protein